MRHLLYLATNEANCYKDSAFAPVISKGKKISLSSYLHLQDRLQALEALKMIQTRNL